MLTSESFFALIQAPSVYEQNSSRISATDLPAYPSSRSWMNQAFSTIRVASRKSLIPCSSQKARSAFTFAIETGWPPAMLTVPASET